MGYKRVFLLRCCNTAIVRSRAQLIAYREPLCNWREALPLGDAALWAHCLSGRAWAGAELPSVPLAGRLRVMHKLHSPL